VPEDVEPVQGAAAKVVDGFLIEYIYAIFAIVVVVVVTGPSLCAL
jgi:hypothetical protein